MGGPGCGYLREDADTGPHVLTALRVVGGGADQRIGPPLEPPRILLVKRGEGLAIPRGVAPYLIERDEAVVEVERGVLDALGGDGAGGLLEAHGKAATLGLLVRVASLGMAHEQRIAEEVEDRHVHGGISLLGLGHRAIDIAAVPAARLVPQIAHVGAVDGESGDDLPDDPNQAREGEIAREAIALRDAIEVQTELDDFAGHGHLHDEPLGRVAQIGHGLDASGEAGIGGGHLARGATVDEEAVDRAEIVVARRTRHCPPVGERLFGHQNLLGGNPEWPGALSTRVCLSRGTILGRDGQLRVMVELGMEPARRRDDGAFLEAKEVFPGGIETVGMVHPDPPDLALADQAKDQLVACREDLGALHPDGGQIIDVEEAAIVDLIPGHPPVGEPVGLLGEERIQVVEACGVSGGAVEQPNVVVDEVANMLRLLEEGGESALHHFLLPESLLDAGGLGVDTVGQMGQRRENALELLEVSIIVADPGHEIVESMREDSSIGIGSYGQAGARAPQDEGALGEPELKLPRLEYPTILIRKNRKKHLVP